MAEPITYEIRTIKDIFDKVPASRIPVLMGELATMMGTASAMRDIPDFAAGTDGTVLFPETVTWIDDDKGNITLELEGVATLQATTK